GGVIAVRTVTFAPQAVADGSAIKVAPLAPFDTNLAARHLAEAVLFRVRSDLQKLPASAPHETTRD
ncbi:MAG: hypothetical protein ACLGHR_13180, partial [Gammaproteobacteria bacterium]